MLKLTPDSLAYSVLFLLAVTWCNLHFVSTLAQITVTARFCGGVGETYNIAAAPHA